MSEIVLIKDAVIQASNHVTRAQIMELEDAIKEMPNQVDMTELTNHYFADGIYLRELSLPAGTVATGKIHRTRHITIIASGSVQITTDNGVKEVTGPAVFVSEAGIKKAVYAITDCVIMNAHPTMETDLVKIEEQFIAPSFEALEHHVLKEIGQ